MVTIISLGIIAALAACMFIVSGVHQQRVHQLRGFPHPRTIAGIFLLLFAIAQIINELVPVYATHLNMNRDTITSFDFVANITGILMVVPILYAALFRVRNRQ
jgi:uncharacterized membrane protein YidH (DUF202 family)